MRVKLAYTVEEEDVLAEAAKIISLSGENMQTAVELFDKVREELQSTEHPKESTKINTALGLLDEFRQALLGIDIRLSEVMEIVGGYSEYRRAQRENDHPSPEPPDEESIEGSDQ